MRFHFGEEVLQREALRALQSLSRFKRVRERMKATRAVRFLCKVVLEYMTSVQVVSRCCWVFANLNAHGEFNQELIDSQAVHMMLVAAAKRRTDTELQAAGCALMQNLVLHWPPLDAALLQKAVELVRDVMRHHTSDIWALRWALVTMLNLGLVAGNRARLRSGGCIPFLFEVLRLHPRDVVLQRRGLGTVLNLTLEEDTSDFLGEIGATELVLSAMRFHPSDEEVLERGCALLNVLACQARQNQEEAQARSQCEVEAWVHTVRRAMSTCPDNVELHRSGCSVLVQLSKGQKSVDRECFAVMRDACARFPADLELQKMVHKATPMVPKGNWRSVCETELTPEIDMENDIFLAQVTADSFHGLTPMATDESYPPEPQ